MTYPHPTESGPLLLRAWILVGALFCTPAQAGLFSFLHRDDPGRLVVCGGSLAEGVQSADANLRTQPWSFANLVARQMGAEFRLPLIVSGPLGVVGDVSHRHRLAPFVRATNLARSGADVNDVIGDRADAYFPWEIDTETDLVLYPRRGTQLGIARRSDADTIICWVGSNDVLAAVMSFDRLDASQMTDVEAFKKDFRTLVAGLARPGRRLVFGTIPDVTRIAFLMDREDAKRFLGEDLFADESPLVPEGSLTSVVAVFLVRLGLADPEILADSHYLLDAHEIHKIQDRVDDLNRTIREVIGEAETKKGVEIALADTKALFDRVADTPPSFFGHGVGACYLCGQFSLDGVHPSNIGHALVANAFIRALNETYGSGIPPIGEARLNWIFLTDPFQDIDGDLRVRGRPLAGLLETLGPALGISGDLDDFEPQALAAGIDTAIGRQFRAELEALRSQYRDSWDPEDGLREVFGLRLFGHP